MNWYKLAQISYRDVAVDDIYDEDDGFDSNAAVDEAYQVFQGSGVHPDSRKDVTNVALSDGTVIGAVASSWSESNEYDFPVMDFSFDVAVDSNFRTNERVGLKLIQAAIDKYESEKSMYEEMDYKTRMYLWVINPKLVSILERKFGFELESELGEGQAHMVRY